MTVMLFIWSSSNTIFAEGLPKPLQSLLRKVVVLLSLPLPISEEVEVKAVISSHSVNQGSVVLYL